MLAPIESIWAQNEPKWNQMGHMSQFGTRGTMGLDPLGSLGPRARAQGPIGTKHSPLHWQSLVTITTQP